MDATFVLVGALAAVAAYRYGAAAAGSEERRDAVTRGARLLTSGAMAASSAAVGTVAADGTAPTATVLLFGVAGIALASAFTVRLGIRVSASTIGEPSPGPSLGERYGKALVTMVLTAVVAFLATNALD